MDLRKIKKLIELLEESALSEMEISEGENTIRLSRATSASPIAHPPPTSMSASPPSPAHAMTPVGPQAAPPADDDAAAGNIVNSPLVGTFYNSPSPDDAPYVKVGSKVNKGDTLCLIEAMKTFNQLDADIAGTVSAIHKNNGDPVEYGEPLFVIDPS